METIEKQNITIALRRYCERFTSQNRAANTLKDVSPATISQILNGKWDAIADEMWRTISAQIGHNTGTWAPVETSGYLRLMYLLDDIKTGALVMGITGEAGSGKTFAMKQFAATHPETYHLLCNEYWNRKLFLSELLTAMGRDTAGNTVGEMMADIVRRLKRADHPMIILDEADKLTDNVLYFFITLYNQLEDECGIVLCATPHLERRLQRGIRLGKKGYTEIWSRLGRRCVHLPGVTAADIAAVCNANGIESHPDIEAVISDSESDLRRVKRCIHALSRKNKASKTKSKE